MNEIATSGHMKVKRTVNSHDILWSGPAASIWAAEYLAQNQIPGLDCSVGRGPGI